LLLSEGGLITVLVGTLVSVIFKDWG
jgi:hypothetical protein